MTFELIAFVMTGAGALLGLRFLLAGDSIMREWGLEPSPSARIMCRRLGALYLGLALVFFLGRNAAPSELRTALCVGIGVASAMLASLGVFELVARRARRRILISVVTEVLLAAALVWVATAAAP